MFKDTMVIWSDVDFVQKDGSPEEGAEIYGECFRCHPSVAKKVQEGLMLNMNLNLKIVTQKPELYHASDK